MWLFGSGFPKHKSKLKPGYEPIILARKPAQRATPLQIDACRIAERWPSNVGIDSEAATLLDEQSTAGVHNGMGYHGAGPWPMPAVAANTGGASRFFYVAKASRSEREAGCADLPTAPGGANDRGFTEDVAAGNDRNRPVHNHHPTVKPIALMRWLCRLVTPPAGVVLDPFAGSGSTGCAAVQEGLRFVGIEREQAYADIAAARLEHWTRASLEQMCVELEATT